MQLHAQAGASGKAVMAVSEITRELSGLAEKDPDIHLKSSRQQLLEMLRKGRGGA